MLKRYLLCVCALGAVALLMILTLAGSTYLELARPDVGSCLSRTLLSVAVIVVLCALSLSMLRALDEMLDDGDDDDWRRGGDDLPRDPNDPGGFDWPRFEAQFRAYARDRELAVI